MVNFRRGAFKSAYKMGAKRYSKGGKLSSGKIIRDVNYLRQFVNTEKKFLNTVSAGTTLAAGSTGTLVLLNGAVTGDTAYTREGNSMKMSYLYIEGFIQLNTSTQDITRLNVVLDKQPNGAATTYADIFDTGAGVSGCIALRNPATVDRYKVLKQIFITLDNNGNQMKKFKCWIKLGQHTKYNNGNAGTIADISTNALYFCFAGDNTTNMSVIDYYARVRFIDN